MLDDSNDSTRLIDEQEFNLPPPRFDESAAARAQPVQPIRNSKLSALHKRFDSLGQALASGSRALVLVVIGGLATGILGGVALVKEPEISNVSATEPLAEIAPANAQIDEPRAEVSGDTQLQDTRLMSTQIRRSRVRVKTGRAPRAYRVAVIH